MTDRLHTQLEPTVAGLGYELLGIERGRANGEQLLRLFIDHADGITVVDCERVSRQVTDVIEVDQLVSGDFTLEVSSPGLDRPLFTLEQHQRFVGAQVLLRLRTPLDGRRRLKGALRAVSADALVMEVDDVTIEVPFREVDRSRLSPEWPVSNQRGRKSAAD